MTSFKAGQLVDYDGIRCIVTSAFEDKDVYDLIHCPNWNSKSILYKTKGCALKALAKCQLDFESAFLIGEQVYIPEIRQCGVVVFYANCVDGLFFKVWVYETTYFIQVKAENLVSNEDLLEIGDLVQINNPGWENNSTRGFLTKKQVFGDILKYLVTDNNGTEYLSIPAFVKFIRRIKSKFVVGSKVTYFNLNHAMPAIVKDVVEGADDSAEFYTICLLDSNKYLSVKESQLGFQNAIRPFDTCSPSKPSLDQDVCAPAAPPVQEPAGKGIVNQIWRVDGPVGIVDGRHVVFFEPSSKSSVMLCKAPRFAIYESQLVAITSEKDGTISLKSVSDDQYSKTGLELAGMAANGCVFFDQEQQECLLDFVSKFPAKAIVEIANCFKK